jgi:hypothetical protein
MENYPKTYVKGEGINQLKRTELTFNFVPDESFLSQIQDALIRILQVGVLTNCEFVFDDQIVKMNDLLSLLTSEDF